MRPRDRGKGCVRKPVGRMSQFGILEVPKVYVITNSIFYTHMGELRGREKFMLMEWRPRNFENML